MKNKKVISLAIVMILLLAQFSMLIGNVNAETTTGTNETVSWSFDDETGTLTLSGSGELTGNWENSINSEDVEKVIIQNGIDSIGEMAFTNYSNLASIEISNSVTKIGKAAFYGCISLASIEIPDNVISIDSNAFGNCTGLTSIKL